MQSKLTVDSLAQEIRRVDGNHSLGAGALAEALMPFLSALSDKQAGEVSCIACEGRPRAGNNPCAVCGRSALVDMPAAIPTANCCVCGRIIDTREISQGGDNFGAETAPGKWTCSMECDDVVTGYVPDVPAVEPVAASAWLIEDGTGHAWFTVIPSKAQEAKGNGCEVTPLYTSPPLTREGEDSAEVGDVEFLLAVIDYMSEATGETPDPEDAAQIDRIRLAATRSGSATTSTGGDHG